MTTEMVFEQRIPVRYEADVCVVGAGPAGCAAAVTAARSGAEVLLVEAWSMAGGMSTAARVPVFMVYSDGVRVLCGGFGEEVMERLRRQGAAKGFDGADIINAEHLKRVYEDLLEEAGVRWLYHARLGAVRGEGGRVDHGVFAGPGGLFAAKARIFVDATGDGSLAAWAGAPFEYGDPATGAVMPSTLCSVWAGFDWEAYRAAGAFGHDDELMPKKLEQAFAAGRLSQEDYHLTGLYRISETIALGNLSHEFGVDPRDEQSLTRGLVAGRRRLAEYEAFYRAEVAGFARAEIVESGSMLGVRESRRILGDYILDFEDFMARRTFPDEIGRYNFAADIHPSDYGWAAVAAHKKQHRETRMGPGESYGIPYRILLPRGLDNVLACGRCVSADRRVYSSLRAIPGCYITGQAAGMAAALCLENGRDPRALDTETLRERLKEKGAYFR